MNWFVTTLEEKINGTGQKEEKVKVEEVRETVRKESIVSIKEEIDEERFVLNAE